MGRTVYWLDKEAPNQQYYSIKIHFIKVPHNCKTDYNQCVKCYNQCPNAIKIVEKWLLTGYRKPFIVGKPLHSYKYQFVTNCLQFK